MTTLQPGAWLGPYQILGEIGRGGMAAVYKAHQANLDRAVALKVLMPELANDPEFVARFQREATIAARLEHPHVVPIYDIGRAEDHLYIAMRYVPGASLDQVIAQQGTLPIPRAVAILRQVADALDHAHANGVVHRDLKPANILIEAGDRSSLADFGIAKAGEGGTRLTRLGSTAGTPEYMAPEQASGANVDYRADLYALGIIAYELLAGRTPFEADSGVAVLHKQVYEAPHSLRALHPEIPEAVDAAVRRMLSKRADERFPSAGAFVAALGGQRSESIGSVWNGPRTPTPTPRGTPLPAHPPGAAGRPRRAAAWLPIGAAAAAILVIGAIFALARNPTPEQRQLSITPEPVAADVVQAGAQATAIQPTVVQPAPLPPTAVPPTPLPTLPPTVTPIPTLAKPELTTGDISPRSAYPGDTITFTMELYNPNSAPVDAVLGASIRMPGASFIDDPNNDQRVTIQPGRGIYKRIFRIPVGTPGGRYEVLWGLHSTDTPPVSHGLKSEDAALQVLQIAPPPAPPTTAPVQVADAAVSVRNFYTYIAQRNYQPAYALYSRRLQSTIGYSGWVNGYATTESVGGIYANTLTQSGAIAVVSFGVSSVDLINAQHVNKTFQGTWDMVREDGLWKLDRPHIQQV
jgi:predicted Ser/Thr protein kinase